MVIVTWAAVDGTNYIGYPPEKQDCLKLSLVNLRNSLNLPRFLTKVPDPIEAKWQFVLTSMLPVLTSKRYSIDWLVFYIHITKKAHIEPHCVVLIATYSHKSLKFTWFKSVVAGIFDKFQYESPIDLHAQQSNNCTDWKLIQSMLMDCN